MRRELRLQPAALSRARSGRDPASARKSRRTPSAKSRAAVEIAWGVVVEIENQPKPALAAEWLVRVYS